MQDDSSSTSGNDVLIEGPRRIGITTDSKNREVEWKATFTPASGVTNAAPGIPVGSTRAEIVAGSIQKNPATGVMTFKIKGKSKSIGEDDVTVKIVTPPGWPPAQRTLTVTLPKKVGSPRPVTTYQPVAGAVAKNLSLNAGTVPGDPDTPVGKWNMVSAVSGTLSVQIMDHLDKPLEGYDGETVYETKGNATGWSPFYSLNVQIANKGIYTDSVGIRYFTRPAGTPNPTTVEQDAIDWTNAATTGPNSATVESKSIGLLPSNDQDLKALIDPASDRGIDGGSRSQIIEGGVLKYVWP
ncbi:hypothetical protein [Verrucomicrobium sp. BvORR106]|uniref:hypothetical protein n=1 Tax=Verrucomicrobium sp. BvORR106 TaxID=1403819 RepID=UPI002240FE2C|nr:hypothetical protein [Verrucomicrobium sp. BvORR106]